MSATKEGLQRLPEFFLYGMTRAAEGTGTLDMFLRATEEEGLRKFMLVNMPGFRGADTPLEACRAYTVQLDATGLMDATDTSFRGDDDSIRGEVGASCVHRGVCTLRHDEGLPVRCIRAIALSEMLRVRLHRDYTPKLDSFGVPCRFRLTKSPWR
jgi:hypothetical protein